MHDLLQPGLGDWISAKNPRFHQQRVYTDINYKPEQEAVSMKKSTRAGLILALGLTMSSSFIVWDHDTEIDLPFGLPSAQASASGTPGTSGLIGQGQVSLRDAALQDRRMNALVSRVRKQLASHTP